MRINLWDFIKEFIGRSDVGNTDKNVGECVGLSSRAICVPELGSCSDPFC